MKDSFIDNEEVRRNKELNEKWMNRKPRKRPKGWQQTTIINYPEPYVPYYSKRQW